jgi:hypothetical protein
VSLRGEKPAKHGRDHDLGGEDPIRILLERKVFADNKTVTTGDGKFIWATTRDMDNSYLLEAQAFVTTVSSSGAPAVQIRNITRGVDMLSTKVTIDVSEFTSYTAATASVVDDTGSPAKSFVVRGDLISIDVDVAGTGAKGLGVYLVFGPKAIPGP